MKFVVSHKWLNSARCDNHRGKKPLVRLTNYERDLRSGLLLCEECCKALFEDEKLLEHFKVVSYGEETTDETTDETNADETNEPEEDSVDELEKEIDELEKEVIDIVTEEDEKKVIKATLNETTEVKDEPEVELTTDEVDELHEEAEQESLFGDEEEVDELLADVDELLAPEDKSPKLAEENVESDIKSRVAKAENLNELRDIAKEVGCNLRSMTNIKNIKTKLVRHIDSMEV